MLKGFFNVALTISKSFKKAVLFGAVGFFGILSVSPRLEDAVCIDTGNIKTPKTASEKRLVRLFDNAALSPTGKLLAENVIKENGRICFDEKDNNRSLGSYDGDRTIILTPDKNWRDDMMEMVLVHEEAHFKQPRLESTKDFTEYDRKWEVVVQFLLGEAVARMTSIVHAYEMKQKGNPQYWESWMRREDEAPMMQAFEHSLMEKPDDLKAAMAAAVLAFQDSSVFQKYALSFVVMTVSREEPEFLYLESKIAVETRDQTILTDQYLRRFGDNKIYGNYMTKEVMAAARRSFSEAQYEQYKKVFMKYRDEYRRFGSVPEAAYGELRKAPAPAG